MKILFFTISYPPFKIGGTEVYVKGLAESLVNKGVSCGVSFLCDNLQVLQDDILKCGFNGVEVFPVCNSGSGINANFKIDCSQIYEFKNLIEFWKPDVIHFHPLTLPVFLPWLQLVNNIPVVLIFHSSTTTCLRGDLLWHGVEDCLGVIDRKKCVECFQQCKGLPIVLVDRS